MSSEMTRRFFLKTGSLVLAASAVTVPATLFNASPGRGAAAMPFKPHAFLEIGADETVTVWVGQTDLGQGTHTGIAMVIADKLDGAWERVQVKMALAAEPFKDPQWHAQLTGGSSSFSAIAGTCCARSARPPGRCWWPRPRSSGRSRWNSVSPGRAKSSIRTAAASATANWRPRPEDDRCPHSRP